MQGLNWPQLVRRLQLDVAARTRDASASRDENAWQQIATHTLKVARIVARQVGLDDHQELAQDVLLRLQSPDVLRRMLAAGAPEGYLFVIVRNRASDIRKRLSLEASRIRGLDESRTVEAPADTTERMVSLRQELARLTPDDRELLRLRFWQGMAITEIARRRNEPYSRVAVRLFRLTRRLRHLLAEDGL
jgi:RNA polymerase sigma factor (sigma-70 family)